MNLRRRSQQRSPPPKRKPRETSRLRQTGPTTIILYPHFFAFTLSAEADRSHNKHSLSHFLLAQDAADEEAFEEDPEEAVFEVEEGREEPESGGQHCCRHCLRPGLLISKNDDNIILDIISLKIIASVQVILVSKTSPPT